MYQRHIIIDKGDDTAMRIDTWGDGEPLIHVGLGDDGFAILLRPKQVKRLRRILRNDLRARKESRDEV